MEFYYNRKKVWKVVNRVILRTSANQHNDRLGAPSPFNASFWMSAVAHAVCFVAPSCWNHIFYISIALYSAKKTVVYYGFLAQAVHSNFWGRNVLDKVPSRNQQRTQHTMQFRWAVVMALRGSYLAFRCPEKS